MYVEINFREYWFSWQKDVKMSACMSLASNEKQADFESQLETTKSTEYAKAFNHRLIPYLYFNDGNI